MKKTRIDRKKRIAKSFEEQKVENAIFFSILPVCGVFSVLILFTPLLRFLNSLGGAWAVSGLVIIFMSLNAVCSTLLGILYHFSARQFCLLGKYIVAINGGVSIFSIAYSYTIFILFYTSISNSSFPAIPLIGIFNVIIIAAAIFLRKIFRERVSQYFRIDHMPNNASIEFAAKSLAKAEQGLTSRNFEDAAIAFHSAAIIFVNLEKWLDAAECYLRAAEAYSFKKNTVLGSSFLYGLAAAAFVLAKNSAAAKEAIEHGRRILDAEKIPGKDKQRISGILALVETIAHGDVEKTGQLWKLTQRKVARWNYPITEEIIILIGKNIDVLASRH